MKEILIALLAGIGIGNMVGRASMGDWREKAQTCLQDLKKELPEVKAYCEKNKKALEEVKKMAKDCGVVSL